MWIKSVIKPISIPGSWNLRYRKGALAFDGGVYPGIGMRLNVYIERLIVLSPDRRLHVIVPPERIPRCGLMKLLTALRGTTGHA